MTNYSSAYSKLESKKATIGVVGLGYVGLPLINTALSADFSAIGFDVDEKKVDLLSKGESYIEHVDTSILGSAINKKLLLFFHLRMKYNDAMLSFFACLPRLISTENLI